MEIVGKVTETREFRQTVMNTVGDRSSLDACEADLKRTRKELHSQEHLKYKLGRNWIIWMFLQKIMMMNTRLFSQRLMRFMTESRFWRKGSGS